MKNCTGCGAQLNDESIFCTNCGTRYSEPKPPANQVFTQATQPPYQYQQPPYQQYQTYQQPVENEAPLSVGTYIVMFILYAIPIVNLICLLIWAFGHSNKNKKNFARAALVILAISFVLSLIFGFLCAIFGAEILSEIADELYYYI